MIEIISPAGFEHSFWGLADQLTDGPPDPEELARLAAMHGLVFQDAPWVPDLVERYGLTPLPPR